MKTIGEYLKDARIQKKYSIEDLEEITKIKGSFIKSIENDEWKNLPNASTTLGFVKSLAEALGLEEKTVTAFFKRDYVNKSSLPINPKPDVTNKFSWSPKLTFGIGVTLILLIILGYLGFQYKGFNSAPTLDLQTPQEGSKVDGKYVVVSGVTETDAKIVVNNQPVIVDQDGKFLVGLEINDETNEIVVTATSRSGKMTEVKRKIEVEK